MLTKNQILVGTRHLYDNEVSQSKNTFDDLSVEERHQRIVAFEAAFRAANNSPKITAVPSRQHASGKKYFRSSRM